MTDMLSLSELPNSAANPLPPKAINLPQHFDIKNISDDETAFTATGTNFSLLSGKTRQGLHLFGAQADRRRPEVLFEMGERGSPRDRQHYG